jgi:tRNA 5-methylaminomethyl-2-thiouridine biosynthesis bifunctional protein
VFTPLIPSVPAFEETGVPFSLRYGDVYRALQGGVEQARQVFLQGNGLPGRWRGRERFTVCETGFGLGLNFLTLWSAWRDDPARCARLHVVSVEAHPFAREHLAELLAREVPDAWRDMVEQLLRHWPPLLPGLHRLDLDGGAVTLTLAFGMAEAVVPQLTASVDAFFLDGFKPRLNPQMWSPFLIRALARLAAQDATAASWTSVGEVRRILQSVGFEVQREQGFGGKLHRIEARFAPRFERRHAPVPPPVFARKRALVIGAGIAGAGVAHALALRGWQVEVFDPATQTAGPGHLAAALTPLLARDDSPRARLTRAGALRAMQRWAPFMDGNIVARCGTVQVAKSDEQVEEMHTTVDVLGFPPEWVRPVSREEACALAGAPVARGGVYFADGLLVRPRALCEALLAQPGIRLRHAGVARIERVAQQWRLLDETGASLDEAEVVVVANATGAPRLLQASGLAPDQAPGPKFFQQKAVAGQITLLPEHGAGWRQAPRRIVAGEGYVLPAVDGYCVTGGTYVYDAAQAVATAEGHGVNLERAAQLLPELTGSALAGKDLTGWAGWRAIVPGRLPVIGELPGAPGLWLATGCASRGLTWSALAGDVIAATLEGEPQIIERDLLRTVFWR